MILVTLQEGFVHYDRSLGVTDNALLEDCGLALYRNKPFDYECGFVIYITVKCVMKVL